MPNRCKWTPSMSTNNKHGAPRKRLRCMQSSHQYLPSRKSATIRWTEHWLKRLATTNMSKTYPLASKKENPLFITTMGVSRPLPSIPKENSILSKHTTRTENCKGKTATTKTENWKRVSCMMKAEKRPRTKNHGNEERNFREETQPSETR